jgi:hypothetical protein
MLQRFGSDPLDAAPAAVLRALHRRGAGQLVRVTTSPSHVALTVAARSHQCTLVFATAEAPAPRDAVEALAKAVAEGDGAVACAVPRARAIRHGPHAEICLSESKKSTNATLVIVEAQGRADVWCTADMGWRRVGSSQLTDATVSSAAFDGRRVFWREATGVFCRALGRRGGRLAVGLRARAADAPPDYLVAAGRGRGAWRVSAAPLVVRRGAFEKRLGGSGVVCRDGDELLVVADTGDVMRVAYEETGLATTTWGRVKAHCRAVAPVPGGVALLGATGVVAFCPRRPFSEPVSCVAAPLNAVALWVHRGGVAVRDDHGGVWTLRPPDFSAPPPPPKRIPPQPAPPPARRRPPRRDWKTASDALSHARHLAEAPSTAPLPSLHRAARLARELGLDPTSLFADGDELPMMLFFCRERRRDRWFGGFELFCQLCLVLRPGALPQFVADVCRAKRRSRAMRGEATDSSSGPSDVSSDDGASDAEEGLLFWAGAPAPPAAAFAPRSSAPAVRVELPRRRGRAGDASYERRAVDCLRVAPGLAPAQRAAVEAVHSRFSRKRSAGDLFG